MNLPNRITISRVLLIPVFVGCILYWRPGFEVLRLVALTVFAVACLTDAADGLIARHTHQRTRLGNLLDPLADKLLLISAYLTLTLVDHIPSRYQIPEWLTSLVIFRDVILVAGVFIIHALYGRFEASPNRIGKLTTVTQMGCILLVLYGLEEGALGALYLVTGLMTVISGVLYLRMGTRIFSNGGTEAS